MTKMTIEEMALKAYPDKKQKIPTTFGVITICNQKERDIFIEGAKAVLEEIEKALPFSIRYGYANEKIVEIIKQLKG